jgi:hypothetical protein
LLPLSLLPGACQPASGPAVADLQTRAESTDYVETTRYDEAVEFMRAVADASPRMHLETMGYTSEGRAIPMMVVGDLESGDAETVRASGKLLVYLQGNIHGGEVPGKEALLMLLREMAMGERPGWMEEMVLLVVPIYNADGNERVQLTNRPRQHGPIGGMGQRPNAMGLDLNRDHMKLDSPEARSLVGMLSAYDPHVGVDLHTTNGTRHAYHLTYAEPLNPATDPGIIRFIREDWMPAVTASVKDRHGWDYYWYGNAFGPGGSEPAWYTFDHRPRFNNNYLGLRNRMAILSEAYSYATFHDRVRATYWFVEEVLDFATARASEIMTATRAADAASLAGTRLSLRAEHAESPQPATILMGEVDRERNPFSGEVILRRRDVSVPTPMREFVTFRSTLDEVVPEVYWVPAEMTIVRERLDDHGIGYTTGNPSGPVEEFAIRQNTVAERAFQGHNERTLEGAWRPRVGGAPTGGAAWLRVPTDQPLGRLAFYLLEPQSDDGLLNWALLDEWVAGAPTYPILRESAGTR